MMSAFAPRLIPRRLHGAIVVALACLVAVAPAAPAQAPAVVSGPVTDAAGVLTGGDGEQVESVLAAGRRRGVDLHVLFVEDTAGVAATRYAENVATESSMGGDDALLMVAFDDRTYALWVGDALDVDGREIAYILDELVAPRLRADEIPRAVEAAVGGLLRAAATSRGGGGGGGRGAGTFPLVPLILFGLLILFVASWFRRMRRRAASQGSGGRETGVPAPDVDVGALAAEANAALVRVDDQLQDAAHESGFAEAQFGAEEAASLREGLDRARAELKHAFALRQELDDHVPEPVHEQVDMLQRILGHARAAEAIVAERLARLEELRGLERDPAAAVAELRLRLDRVSQRLPAAEAAEARLRADAPSAAAAVEGNLGEASKRLAFVREQLDASPSAPAADAARALRAAGAAVAQAEQLVDALEDLAQRVLHAREALPRELQEAELALARAEDLVRSRRHVVGREARTRLVQAQRHFDRARSLAESDPGGAAAEADAAERLADAAYELAYDDSEAGGGEGYGGGGIQGFGWGLPMPIPFPFPVGGGGIGWGGTSWGGGFGGGFGGGGMVGGGSFGGGVGGGRW